jgi:hypothetical protein
MKPKPFSALNHFTVPAAMSNLLRDGVRSSALRALRVAAMIIPPENSPEPKKSATSR